MNETFTNEDEAREIFGRLKPGVTLRLGEREYVIRGRNLKEGGPIVTFWEADQIEGPAQTVCIITLESVLNTLNAGREVKIVEASGNEPKAPERNSGRSVEEEEN